MLKTSVFVNHRTVSLLVLLVCVGCEQKRSAVAEYNEKQEAIRTLEERSMLLGKEKFETRYNLGTATTEVDKKALQDDLDYYTSDSEATQKTLDRLYDETRALIKKMASDSSH
jgi:hypothetical protein